MASAVEAPPPAAAAAPVETSQTVEPVVSARSRRSARRPAQRQEPHVSSPEPVAAQTEAAQPPLEPATPPVDPSTRPSPRSAPGPTERTLGDYPVLVRAMLGPLVERCFAQHDVYGDITVRLTVSSAGTVVRSTAVSDSPEARPAADCVSSHAISRTMPTPPHGGGTDLTARLHRSATQSAHSEEFP